MASHILALDQGTTSSRAIVFADDGTPSRVEQREFRQIFPKPGWVEHDPEEIWSSQRDVAERALEGAGIAAIGITNQRETTIIWDRETGEPIHNAIVWQDRRTAGICDKLRSDGLEPLIRERTGLVIDAYFAGTKIAWLLDHVDGARDRAERGELAFGTIDSWLVWKLTEGRAHLTDFTNASRTMLMNLRTGRWDDELLEALNVPRGLLPEIRDSSEVYAEVSVDSPLRGLPIAGIAGDQQAALVGQACFGEGLTKNTYGTGCFMLMNTGPEPRPSKSGLVTTAAWRIGKDTSFALEGSIFVAGAIVQWLRDGLGIINSSNEVENLASSVPDSGGVMLVPALAGLGAPDWDPYARGGILGLTRGATRAHIARAALEGIAFAVSDLIEAMRSDAGRDVEELRVDGGASVNAMLMQFQADVLQVPVVRPVTTETTALGAAFLAGLATDVWKSFDDTASAWREDQRFDPKIPAGEAKALRERWRDAVERCKSWERP
jgi:glycerol kinase